MVYSYVIKGKFAITLALVFFCSLFSLSHGAYIGGRLRVPTAYKSVPAFRKIEPVPMEKLRNTIPRIEVDQLDFGQDFQEVQPEWIDGETEILSLPNKRFLGVDIPDYVADMNKGNMLEKISNRMREAGK